jgi:glycosyltransferase involved in cell wall biosynthesis
MPFRRYQIVFLAHCLSLAQDTITLKDSSYDLTLVSTTIDFASGLGRIPIMLIDLLKDELAINIVPNRHTIIDDIPLPVINVLRYHMNNKVGKVALLLTPLWLPGENSYQQVPPSPLRIAYSMVESTVLPHEWTKILNRHFDAVVVPDNWLVPVYKQSGVTIPIFVLPLGLYLKQFVSISKSSLSNNVFTFGSSAGAGLSKNHLLLIQAFYEEFGGDNPNVQLRIHSNGGHPEFTDQIAHYINTLKAKNIEFIPHRFSNNSYIDFLSSLHTYVLISKGEGFSVTPREALALGKVCIISDNTGHRTLCKSGFFVSITSNQRTPAYSEVFKEIIGDKFDCSLADIKRTLRKVFNNYSFYAAKAQLGRRWVYNNYEYMVLKKRYLSLIKPKKVFLGTKNRITDEYIMTNSSALAAKYSKISGKNYIRLRSR